MDRVPGIASVLAVALLVATTACADPAVPAVGTPELRAALFDTIMARTARRTAFSQPKQHALGFEPLSAMRSLRDDVVAADSEEKLFYALARLSHARRDRHLDVALVPGGLSLPDSTGIDIWDGPAAPEPRQAPIRVFPDYGVEGPAYFVGDVADDETLAEGPEPGWAVLSVNGLAIAEYEAALREWTRHSSLTGLRWKIAEALTKQTAALPPELRAEVLHLDVEAPDGTRRSVTLPYREAATLRWEGRSEPRPGPGVRSASGAGRDRGRDLPSGRHGQHDGERHGRHGGRGVGGARGAPDHGRCRVKEVRTLFPGAGNQVYLDVSLRSLIPIPVAEAVERHIRERLSGTGDKSELQAAVERSRELMAELLGCTSDEIAITKNVSEGLNLFAASLPWTAGDNVVICPELEHPNNVFVWYNLRKLKGVEVRALEPDEGRVPVEAMAAAVDERTRLVTVPHVSFSPGFITDVRTVADAAHLRGALLLVDGAQSVGAIRTRVDELGFDALAVATQKSLLSLYGFGFLYVCRPLAETLVPAHVARYGMDLGTDAGETARSEGDLPYAAGARRFDIGNFNYLGARAAAVALSLIREWGVERIEAHVRALATRLAAGMLELGLPVAGGAPGPHLGHIVAVGRSGGGHHDTADDPAMNDLHRYLTDHGVRLSIRRGVLRMSVAVYNDVSDVDRVLELAGQWMGSRSNRRHGVP